MIVSPKLQEHFDKKVRSDIELYLDDLNSKFGLDYDYRLKIVKILELENLEIVSDPRVEKAILEGNKGLNKLDMKKSVKINYAYNFSTNYSTNPYFPNESANDDNYSDQNAA